MYNFIAIKTNDGVFLSQKPNKGRSSFPFSNALRFDGLESAPTYKSDWVKLDRMPTVVEEFVPSKRINVRYEVGEVFKNVDGVKPVVCYDDLYDDEGDPTEYGTKFRALYIEKWDDTLATFNPVEFEIDVIQELAKFDIVQPQYVAKHNLIDEITTHPILLSTRPCSLSSAASFKIIRDYVTKNIDRKIAHASSDYDFCLTVKKNIHMNSPEPYAVDINNDIFTKRKRTPKIVTKYRTDRVVAEYETAPDLPQKGVYAGYTRTPEFTGENYEDMCKNIETFLTTLVARINKPMSDCPHCKGMGVI